MEDAIFTRVSIREFTDELVSDEQVERLMEAAMAAPSAGNQQPWDFYVVTSREKLNELAQVSPYAGCAAHAPLAIVAAYRQEGCRFPQPLAGGGFAGLGRRMAWRGP